jgi:L-asparaginase II
MYIKRGTSRQAQLDELGKEEADRRVSVFKHCECPHTDHHTHLGQLCTEEPGTIKYYCRGKEGGMLRICDKCHIEMLTSHNQVF